MGPGTGRAPLVLGLVFPIWPSYYRDMARKPATNGHKALKDPKQGKVNGSVATQFKKGHGGRPKGALNKSTQASILAARESFAPLAKLGLAKGEAHLKGCKVDGCGSCQFWAQLSMTYVYGKPTQPIEFDSAAIREEIAALALASGKSVEEIEKDAEAAGLAIMSKHRGRT